MNNTDIYDFVDKIKTKDDFVKFLNLFLKDFVENKENWENSDIERFIDGMIGFTMSAEGYYKNMNENFDFDNPSWKNFADILLAAKVYE